MGCWEIVDRARAPGGAEFVLYHRAGEYMIRADGRELMSSRAHGSEEALAALACERLRGQAEPRVLVGGLGLGYTLRAALDALPPGAEAIAVELLPAVVAWNRERFGYLAGNPLADPRVRLVVADVYELLARATAHYDAILLDVDNGPAVLSRVENRRLYQDPGLAAIKRALKPGGILAVWSAGTEGDFLERLRGQGFLVEVHEVPARTAGDPSHRIYRARKPA